MPKWVWYMLWGSQAINCVVTIWAYGTPDGSCLIAPLFTIVWVLKDEVVEDFKVLFGDEEEWEDEWHEAGCREKISYQTQASKRKVEGTQRSHYGVSGYYR